MRTLLGGKVGCSFDDDVDAHGAYPIHGFACSYIPQEYHHATSVTKALPQNICLHFDRSASYAELIEILVCYTNANLICARMVHVDDW